MSARTFLGQVRDAAARQGAYGPEAASIARLRAENHRLRRERDDALRAAAHPEVLSAHARGVFEGVHLASPEPGTSVLPTEYAQRVVNAGLAEYVGQPTAEYQRVRWVEADRQSALPAIDAALTEFARLFTCTCDDAYARRGMSAPDCIFHEVLPELDVIVSAALAALGVLAERGPEDGGAPA